jgi:hypothetical protein
VTGSPAFQNPAGIKTLLGALLGVVVIGLLMTYIVRCPCERIPGTVLFGVEVEEPVSDWAFANAAGLCQIQVQGVIPWSVNLNCMADGDGALYLSCSVCEGKYWSGRALVNSDARVRIAGQVYPVRLTRLQDAKTLDAAWLARASKTGYGVGELRPDHWWSFAVVSR